MKGRPSDFRVRIKCVCTCYKMKVVHYIYTLYSTTCDNCQRRNIFVFFDPDFFVCILLLW